MTRFSRVEFRPLSKKDDGEADEIVRQKSLKLKDAKDRDVSVGSKVLIPDPNEEGTVVRIHRGNVVVKMPQPYRMGPADEVECIRKCGRKAAAPKPAVRFAKTARKSRKRGNNNNDDEKIKFLLKALKIHEASRAPAKSRAPSKSRAASKTGNVASATPKRRRTARRSPTENEE